MTHDRDDPQGHLPTLIACFLHFDLSFMLWVLLGALGIFIAEDLQLSAEPEGPAGRAADSERLAAAHSARAVERPAGRQARRRRDAGVPLRAAGHRLAAAADSWPTLLTLGLMLGTAGASFAVALPLASALVSRQSARAW